MTNAKKCTACKKVKPLAEFNWDDSIKGGHAIYCRSCTSLKNRAYNQSARGKATLKKYQQTEKYKKSHAWTNKKWKLRYKYSITFEQFKLMLEHQESKCAVCGKHISGKGVHIDHNHETGKVRGLLCRCCNIGLGHFGDSAKNLRKAADYLEKK